MKNILTALDWIVAIIGAPIWWIIGFIYGFTRGFCHELNRTVVDIYSKL